MLLTRLLAKSQILLTDNAHGYSCMWCGLHTKEHVKKKIQHKIDLKKNKAC